LHGCRIARIEIFIRHYNYFLVLVVSLNLFSCLMSSKDNPFGSGLINAFILEFFRYVSNSTDCFNLEIGV